MDKSYYSKLLILQYRDKNKAKNTIEATVDNNCKLVNNIFLQFLEAFTVEKAQGKQLDIIGKYVGQSRSFNNPMAFDVFAFADADGVLQDKAVGFSPADKWTSGFFIDEYFLKNAIYSADDDVFRYFIKLKILKNKDKYTDYSIENVIYNFFQNELLFFDNRNMTIDYVVLNQANENIKNILKSDYYLLPAPTGVRINLIGLVNTQKIFSYRSAKHPNVSGGHSVGYSSINTRREGTYLSTKNIL